MNKKKIGTSSFLSLMETLKSNRRLSFGTAALLGIALLAVLIVRLLPEQEPVYNPALTTDASATENLETEEPVSGKMLSFYLLNEKLNPAEAMKRHPSTLRLERYPVLSLDDFVVYDPQACEFELTDDAAERLGALIVPVSGLPFVVVVEDQARYSGAFWTGFSSQSFDEGVVIEVLLSSMNGRARLELGYPASKEFFQGFDWRRDSKFLEVLEQAGKLLHP